MDTDEQLLQSYAETRSEPAFRELVERRINLVHSAALRQSGGDASLAEDITQAVFTELARKASRLARHPALSGWLYTCVRRTSANLHRARNRRQRREQEAFSMNQLLSSNDSDNLWREVRPVLDELMHELNESDRTAIVMRFFEGRSLKEVGQVLGLSENAARMRVERSLEKLRNLLSRRGVKSTASTLAAGLAAGAVLNAPSALASSVATGALTAVATSGISTSMMAKLLSMKTVALSSLLLLGVGLIAWQQFRSNRFATPNSQSRLSSADSTANVPERSSSASAPAQTNTTASSQMLLKVLDAENGEPLSHTKLYLFYMLANGNGKRVRPTTDAKGSLGVTMLQEPFEGLNMFVTAAGHVPKVACFGFGRAMPDEYTMKLERGITIAGVVIDEARRPIAGARIQFDGPGSDMTQSENVQFGPDTPSISDADGRWSCDLIPKDLRELGLVLEHDDYARTTATIHPNTPEATNLVITMAAGFSVAGIVQDSNGNPVAEANVREVRLNSEGELSQVTDANGVFDFRNMKAGELMLSVQARSFAPAVQSLQVTGAVAAIRFVLAPGQLLRGRVVDEEGNPIANTFAEVTRRDIDKVQWSTNADSEGRFEWDSAPQEPLTYSFLAEGFNASYGVQLRADASEHEIKLTRKQAGKDTIQIAGTVTDADTGQPLDDFKVMSSRIESDWAVPLEFATLGKNGEFTWSPYASHLHTNYQIQVEKEGYLPAHSTDLSVNDGNQNLEFKLKKSSGLSGVVLLPGGEPAANATVYLCIPQAGVTINGPAHVEKGINTTTSLAQTDNAGKFSLPPALNPQGIVVVHDQGYAQIPQTESGKSNSIVLQPWGGIEGKVILDGKPVANERVVAYDQVSSYDERGRRVGLMTLHLESKTDSSGAFAFEKVPPGRVTVYRQKILEGENRAGFESHEAAVVVQAGTVTPVVLGGNGRAVIGTAVVPGAGAAVDWQSVPVRLSLKLGEQLGPYPRRHNFSTSEAFIAAMDRWDQLRRAAKSFGTFCERDGSFRLQDIPPGTYELEIRVTDPRADSLSPRERSIDDSKIGSVLREVIVPETSADETREPVDIGTLELVRRHDTAQAH